MSILIGYGKTKNRQDNNQTYISGFFTDDFLSLCPQLKDFRLILNYIPEEKRKSEKSPSWSVEIYKPRENEQETGEEPIIPM